MKSSILRNLVVTLGLGAVTGPAALMAQGEIRITIPFGFTAGGKSLPAGQYTVQEVKNTLLTLRNRRDNAGVMAITLPPEEATRAGMAILTFKRYGESYFLCQVSDGNRSWGLPTSSAEKREIAKSAPPKRVTIATASK